MTLSLLCFIVGIVGMISFIGIKFCVPNESPHARENYNIPLYLFIVLGTLFSIVLAYFNINSDIVLEIVYLIPLVIIILSIMYGYILSYLLDKAYSYERNFIIMYSEFISILLIFLMIILSAINCIFIE